MDHEHNTNELTNEQLSEVTGGTAQNNENPDELWFEGVDVDKVAMPDSSKNDRKKGFVPIPR